MAADAVLTAGGYAGAAVAIIALLAVVWRWVVSPALTAPVQRAIRPVVEDVVDVKLVPVTAELRAIKMQLHPNGGYSLADRVSRIERGVLSIEAAQQGARRRGSQ